MQFRKTKLNYFFFKFESKVEEKDGEVVGGLNDQAEWNVIKTAPYTIFHIHTYIHTQSYH